MLQTDSLAPDFTLPDASGTPVTLRDYRGATVVLVFYPKVNSPVCTRQLTEYAENYKAFEERGAKILAISTDGVAIHDTFRITCAFPFPLLSDSEKSVCQAYDVLNILGVAQRAVYIIDGEGRIRFSGKTFPAWYIKAKTLLQELAV